MPTAQMENAVNQIVDAFANVPLGDGVSLHEADVIDDYGSADERAAAREHDELHDWQRIPDDDMENHSSVLCFMDEEGLRFHLPAYMRLALRRYRDCESMSTDAALYRLCDPDCINNLLAFLTKQQIAAIRTFLTTCLEIGDDWLDVSDVSLALRQWQGDEAGNTGVQSGVRIHEGMAYFRFAPRHGSRVRHTPMGAHGMARPERTHLARRITANGEHKIHFWCIFPCELVPALGAEFTGLVVQAF